MINVSSMLITGANGMVGSNLRDVLVDSGVKLICPSRKELDLLNYSETQNYVAKHRPEFVVHCAGKVGGIQANIKAPTQFLVTNWEMGKNIVLACRNSGVKNFINLGSSCMYPKGFQTPIKEDSLLSGALEPTNEGYALAKISVGKLCEYIHDEDASFNYKTLIPCNLYGPYDKFSPEDSHMIPAVIRKIHYAKVHNLPAVEIWGDGTARREFMFAGDLAAFIKEYANWVDQLPQYLNVGLGHDYSIRDYYDVIAEAIGYKGEFTYDLTKPVGMKRKVVDTSLLNSLGWRAPTTLKEGIFSTYEYFKREET